MSKNPKPINVAFDVDDTIYKVDVKLKRQVPDYDMIAVMRWFYNNGDNIYVWSAGGIDYAKTICEKLGITGIVTDCIAKPELGGHKREIDLTFDDCEIGLGRTNVLVYRKHNEKNYEKLFSGAFC
jgi:hypothetical protein